VTARPVIGPEHHLVDALVADPDGAIDLAEAGTLARLHLEDSRCAAVVAMVGELVGEGHAPFPEVIVGRLVAIGLTQATAVDAVLVPGAFEARGCRVWSVAEALANLYAERQRRHLERRLVSLADTLHRPGGIARVAEALGGEAA